MLWLWILVGALTYAVLMMLLLGVLVAAKEADRKDRAAFHAWRAARTHVRGWRPEDRSVA